MQQWEEKALDFIAKHSLLLMTAGVTVFSVWLRMENLDFVSDDFSIFLQPWFTELKIGGGLPALARPIGNYNVPYLTVLALLTYLPVDPLVSIKIVSIVFDYVAALAAADAIWVLRGKTRHAGIAALCTYTVVILLPTLFLNSAYWAQCDSIYTAFVLLSLCALIRERYTAAFVWFSIGFCFKLQAIFFLPVLVIVYLAKRKFSITKFLWIPFIFLLGDLPALLAGRGVKETLGIYLKQADEYPSLTLNYPNLYYFLMGDYELFAGAGVAITLLLLGLLAVYVLYHKWDIPPQSLIPLALLCMMICLYFLPSMHERYGLTVDILSVMYFALRRKQAYVPIIINLSSMLSYTGFLFGYWVMDLMYFAIAKLFLMVILTSSLIAELRAANPFDLGLTPELEE